MRLLLLYLCICAAYVRYVYCLHEYLLSNCCISRCEGILCVYMFVLPSQHIYGQVYTIYTQHMCLHIQARAGVLYRFSAKRTQIHTHNTFWFMPRVHDLLHTNIPEIKIHMCTWHNTISRVCVCVWLCVFALPMFWSGRASTVHVLARCNAEQCDRMVQQNKKKREKKKKRIHTK